MTQSLHENLPDLLDLRIVHCVQGSASDSGSAAQASPLIACGVACGHCALPNRSVAARSRAKLRDSAADRFSASARRTCRSQQARCAAIFASKGAARNPVLAANLAFKTRMTRAEAIATLEGTPAPAGHSDRAARNPSIGTTAAKQSPQQALAARWDKNLQAVNPAGRR